MSVLLLPFLEGLDIIHNTSPTYEINFASGDELGPVGRNDQSWSSSWWEQNIDSLQEFEFTFIHVILNHILWHLKFFVFLFTMYTIWQAYMKRRWHTPNEPEVWKQ